MRLPCYYWRMFSARNLTASKMQLFQMLKCANIFLRWLCAQSQSSLVSLIDVCSTLILNGPKPFKHYMMDGIQHICHSSSLLFNLGFASLLLSLLTFLCSSSPSVHISCLSFSLYSSVSSVSLSLFCLPASLFSSSDSQRIAAFLAHGCHKPLYIWQHPHRTQFA